MKKWLSYPYFIWSIIFIVFPLALVLFFSFTESVNGSYVFTLANYKRFMEPMYQGILWKSVWLALKATVVCLILGYPMAMILGKMDPKKRGTLVLLLVLPMWMNFLLRTYAWVTILRGNGVLNMILGAIGLPEINILYTDVAVMLGMVYNFLPFMILPIYTVLSKMDNSLVEAATDLGANKVQTFIKVIFPLSLPGVISGITMVFMPAVSTFVISRLLGGGKYQLIGNLVEQQFVGVGNWHFGSAMSVVMMIFILISMGIMHRFDKDGEGKGGGRLW